MKRLGVGVDAEMEQIDKPAQFLGMFLEGDAIRGIDVIKTMALCLAEEHGKVRMQERLSSCKVNEPAPRFSRRP